MINGRKRSPRPEFLDRLSKEEHRALADYLKDHDNEFVSAASGMYSPSGYVVNNALYRFLIAGTRYTERT